MEITVNVDQVDLTSTVGDVRRYDDDAEEYVTEGQTLGDLIAEKVARSIRESADYPGLKRRVADIREEEIREQLKPIITDAIQQGVRKTNHYGEPVGEPTTLRALIVDEVRKLLNSPADTYNSRSGTWAAALVKTEVEKTIRAELAAAIADEKAKVVAAVRAKAADLIATAVKEGVGR